MLRRDTLGNIPLVLVTDADADEPRREINGGVLPYAPRAAEVLPSSFPASNYVRGGEGQSRRAVKLRLRFLLDHALDSEDAKRMDDRRVYVKTVWVGIADMTREALRLRAAETHDIWVRYHNRKRFDGTDNADVAADADGAMVTERPSGAAEAKSPCADRGAGGGGAGGANVVSCVLGTSPSGSLFRTRIQPSVRNGRSGSLASGSVSPRALRGEGRGDHGVETGMSAAAIRHAEANAAEAAALRRRRRERSVIRCALFGLHANPA